MSFEPSIFRAYDIRGIYPDQMNEAVGYAVGQAFVAVTGAKTVAVGRDVRSAGASVQPEVIRGIIDAGADVIDVGIISTEMLYFAAGTLDCDGGLSVTASHNPPQWLGMKMIGKGAVPLVRDGVMGEIYDYVQGGHEPLKADKPGTVTKRDLLADYASYLNKFKPANLPQLKVVANAHFGANGKVVDATIADMPIELVRLNWNEDGTFPKGAPDPLLPRNRVEIEETIVREQADFGVAWDADADRAFFYDEKGRSIPGAYIINLIATELLKSNPGATITYEPRIVWPSQDAIAKGGGVGYPTRVGHAYIKQAMQKTGAVFGGESSGHYYYGDFFRCDNGLITFLIMTGIFARHIQDGGKVSQLLDKLAAVFPVSEETNFITERSAEIMDAAKEKYADGTLGSIDGVSIEYPTWRFNLRRSQTEPVLRLCYEAKTPAELAERCEELTSFIKGFGAELRSDN